VPDISDLVPAKTARPSPQRPPARGVIVAAPDDLQAPTVRVVLPGYSSEYALECRWTRQGDNLPAAGADCLIVFDETGAGFVVWWAIAWP
jgi:hypothetical protein